MNLSELELVRWGERIGRKVRPPVAIGLRGELGAGKSVLARAVARGAGVEGAVPSPTFNLLFRYPADGGREIVHLDLYRLTDPEQLWELGWSELFGEREIVLVEWPERAGDLMPEDRWEIELRIDRDDPGMRSVSVRRVGEPPALPAFPMSLMMEPGEGPEPGSRT